MTFNYQIKYVKSTSTKNLIKNILRLGRIFNIYHLSTKDTTLNKDTIFIQYLKNVIDFLEVGLIKCSIGNEYNQFLKNYLQVLKDLDFILSSKDDYDAVIVFYSKLVTKKLYLRLSADLQDYNNILSILKNDKLRIIFNEDNSYSFKSLRTQGGSYFTNPYMSFPLLYIEKVYYFSKSPRNKASIANIIHSLCQLKGVENLNYLYLENPFNTSNAYAYRELEEGGIFSGSRNIQDFLGLSFAHITEG